LYQKAAERGNATVQHNLGVCYEDGIGVEKDVEKAVELYLNKEMLMHRINLIISMKMELVGKRCKAVNKNM